MTSKGEGSLQKAGLVSAAAALVKRKEYLFSELTRILDLTKKSLSELDAEVQLRACGRLEGSFEKITEEIITLNAQLESGDQVSTKDFATMRVLIDAIVKNCLGAKAHKGSSSTPPVEDRGEEGVLPRLSLPSWDGNVATWLDFKAQFDSLVGSRTGLSGVCKLQYLRSVLKGEPASIVNQYPLSEDSYNQAYNDLVHRYENKRRLASYYLNRILNFRSLNSNSGREHINFIEVHRAASSALNRLEIDLSDFLLFELSYRNLPAKDRNKFDLDHDSDEVPRLKGLLSFVERIARSEELSMDKEPFVSNKADDRKGAKSASIKRSLVVARKPHLCVYCQGDHMLFRCPKILSLPVSARKTQVEQLGYCVSCLYKHPKRACKSKFSCKICGSKNHNTILHPNEAVSRSPTTAAPSISAKCCSSPVADDAAAKVCNNCVSPSSPVVLLATMQCRIRDAWGQELRVRAVLDPGSEISVITLSLADRLGLPKTPSTCRIEGIGRSPRKPLGNVHLKILSLHSPPISYEVRAAILLRICDQLPKSRISSDSLIKFNSLELADPNFREPGEIHLLLGAEVYSDLLSAEEPTVIYGNPTAIRTKFGYVLIGKAQSASPEPLESAVSLCLSTTPLDVSIRRFWEIEETSEETPMDPADVLCEEHFRATHQRDPTGRFIVRLPFLPDATPLESNEDAAMKRLKILERRLDNNPALSKAYQEAIQEYINLGHISIASERASYLLPHHAVFKESSSTTKCRVVFDCSAPDVSGLSLNDRLYRGPPLLDDISLLLIKFRLFKFCLMADVKMMYRMVSIHPADRRNLVIAWRGNQYQMNRLPFGLEPAGYIAGRCILELAALHAHEIPAAAKAICENRYADDFCTGADTLEKAKELQYQLTRLLSLGGFEIRRWSSNVPEALVDVPEVFRKTPIKLPSGESGIKVFGVMWDQSNDAFVAQVVRFESQIISKRAVLSYIARIYDVMGFFSPTVFLAVFFLAVFFLVTLSRARLVGFSDASERGMAAAVYFQWSCDGSSGQARLLKSKTKLAPLKTISIPRLELCAALLLAKTIKPLIIWFGESLASVNLYTDSRTVLAWLNHSPHELKTFVGNRVAEIQRITPSACWSRVAGSENPADLGSRGLSAELLKSSDLWWYGPSFLIQAYENWPESSSVTYPDQLPEVKDDLVLNVQEIESVDIIIRRFSSLSRLQRVIAYTLRFAHNCKCQKNERQSGPLSTIEMKDSLYLAIKLSQEESFGSEIGKIKKGKPLRKELQKLSPFFDQGSGLIRVGGRLGRASFLPEDARHPFLLAKASHLSSLICDHYHELYLHSGPRTTCAAIQRKFWILSLMSLVKKRIHRCRRCHRLNSKPGQPIMADVIPARLDQTYCWSSCALDFGGPFTLKESNKRKSTVHKSYICAFICLTTRAVHLEMVTDLTTQAFLAAFFRFTARRSVPKIIYSDRGTNFVGARTVLREVKNFLLSHHDEIFSAAAAIGTRWRLNAPYSPNFNGCAENCIKGAKALIKRHVGDQILTFEEFATLLCRVEQVLNSRPISFSSRDINDRDVVYLTPGHFITGREMMIPPEEPVDENLSLRDRWNRVRQMAQVFWKTWSTAYLHELMQRGKWNKANKNLQVGDLVYVTGMATTPLSWPLGRVVEVFTNSSDETVRVARIRVREKDIIRPVSKLVIIPTE